MTRRQYFVLSFTVISVLLKAQATSYALDSLNKEKEKWRREHSEIYLRTIKDSVELEGRLVDMTPIVGCGHFGEGMIKIVSPSDSANSHDTTCVVIQCMDLYKSILNVNAHLRLTVTTNKLPYYRDFDWYKCDERTKYYLLRGQLSTFK